MPDPTETVPSLLSALRALPLWMFIGLAAAAYAILFVPPFAGVDATTLRQTWGDWIWAWAIAFSALSLVGIADRAVSTLRSRASGRAARRILRFVPLDHQRWWHLAKQQDDSFASQISFECQASNTTSRPIQIVKVRLIRPRVKQVNAFAMLPLEGGPYHSPDHPVPPHDTVQARVHIMARGVLGKQGRPIRITVGITDQFGEEYRLKNLLIETHDPRPAKLTMPNRARKIRSALARVLGKKKQPPEALPVMPWTYEPGVDYLKTCEAILAEEKRSYAARGRITGKLGSLNVGLQSEPNYGWTKEGEIPQLLWKQGEGTTLASPNLDRLLKLRSSLAPPEGDNLERFLLNQLRTNSPYVEIAYFVVLALHRMHRIVDALTTTRLCLVGDKVYAYSNVLGMLSGMISHEHAQISNDLYQRILDSLAADAKQEFRLREKINLARVQRLDEGKV
jgi:hypothetical protein